MSSKKQKSKNLHKSKPMPELLSCLPPSSSKKKIRKETSSLRDIQIKKSKKYTHQAIADFVGLERSTITKFLNGNIKLPSSKVLLIQQYLNN